MKRDTFPVLGLVTLLLAGCAAGPRPELPKGIPEQIEASALFLKHLDNNIVELTCTKFQAKRCIEPGKPLMPKKAIELHEQLTKVGKGLHDVALIPVNGIGECFGSAKSQAACLNEVSNQLNQFDAYLISQGKK